ncbi:MAG: hypothetical protein ACOYMA_09665 [Bacteroidia bacterium]
MSDKIKCPNCGQSFDVEEALSGKIEAHFKEEFEKKVAHQADIFNKEKNPIDIENFSDDTKKKLIISCDKLMKDLSSNSIMQKAKYQTGDVEFQQFFPQKSKPIIDEIDTLLAQHYGFTNEELDFIINYDIKYCMGKELDNDEE